MDDITPETTVLVYVQRVIRDGWRIVFDPATPVGVVVVDPQAQTQTLHPNSDWWTLAMNAAGPLLPPNR